MSPLRCPRVLKYGPSPNAQGMCLPKCRLERPLLYRLHSGISPAQNRYLCWRNCYIMQVGGSGWGVDINKVGPAVSIAVITLCKRAFTPDIHLEHALPLPPSLPPSLPSHPLAVVNPGEEKFRRIRLGNAKIKAAIADVASAVGALCVLGWTEEETEGEAFLVLPKGKAIRCAFLRDKARKGHAMVLPTNQRVICSGAPTHRAHDPMHRPPHMRPCPRPCGRPCISARAAWPMCARCRKLPSGLRRSRRSGSARSCLQPQGQRQVGCRELYLG
jgi:hypothetical protein